MTAPSRTFSFEDAPRDVGVSGVLVRVLADVVHQRGVAPAALFESSERDPNRPLELDQWLPLNEYQALFSRAIQLTGDPALGLRCGLLATEPSFDVIGPLVSHARTLRHAMELACQFQPLVLDGASLHLSEHAGRAQARWAHPCSEPTLDRGLSELMAAGLVRMLLVFGGTHAELHAVRFTHIKPNYSRAYTEAFGEAVRFSQPIAAIEFESQLLDRPHLHSQPELQALLHAAAERTLERQSRPLSFVERLHALLRMQPVPRSPDMKLAARELGMSARSLRRRLGEEGSSFRAVTQTALQAAACSMVRNPALTFQAISHALGFADVSSFNRAFKRWTGTAPAQFRETALGTGPR